MNDGQCLVSISKSIPGIVADKKAMDAIPFMNKGIRSYNMLLFSRDEKKSGERGNLMEMINQR